MAYQQPRPQRPSTDLVQGAADSSQRKTQPEPGRQPTSTWMATLVILGTIIAAGVYLHSRESELERPLSAAIDGLPGAEGASRPAVSLVTQTIDGRPIRLEDLRGKVVVLDFWATWCPPCRQEIPHLVRLAEKYRDRGLEIVALTIENPETDRENILRFMERFEINYTVGYATDELFTSYIGPGQQPIPQTLIFDRQGRLRKHFISFNAKRDPQIMESLITRLL